MKCLSWNHSQSLYHCYGTTWRIRRQYSTAPHVYWYKKIMFVFIASFRYHYWMKKQNTLLYLHRQQMFVYIVFVKYRYLSWPVNTSNVRYDSKPEKIPLGVKSQAWHFCRMRLSKRTTKGMQEVKTVRRTCWKTLFQAGERHTQLGRTISVLHAQRHLYVPANCEHMNALIMRSR